MSLERKSPQNQTDVVHLRADCLAAFDKITELKDADKKKIEDRINRINSVELLQSYINFMDKLTAYKKAIEDHINTLPKKLKDQFLQRMPSINQANNDLLESYLLNKDTEIVDKFADKLDKLANLILKINQFNELMSKRVDKEIYPQSSDREKWNEYYQRINGLMKGILRMDPALNTQLTDELLENHIKAIEKLLEYKQALDKHHDKESVFCKDKNNLLIKQEKDLLDLLNNPAKETPEKRLDLLRNYIESLNDSILIVNNSDELFKEVARKLKDPPSDKTILDNCEIIYRRSKKLTHSLLKETYPYSDVKQQEKKYLSEILVNTKNILESPNSQDIVKYAGNLIDNSINFGSQYMKTLATGGGRSHGSRMAKEAYDLGNKIKKLHRESRASEERKSFDSGDVVLHAQQPLVTVVELPLVPHVVDINDLGDPEKGYLIGGKGRAILLDPRMDFAKKRYSKAEVRKKMHDNLGLTDNQIDQAFPYLPGIVMDGNGLHAIYKGEQHDKLFGRGSFGKVKAGFNISENKWNVDKVQKPLHGYPISTYEKERDMLKTFNFASGDLVVRHFNYKFNMMEQDTEMEPDVIYFGKNKDNKITYSVKAPVFDDMGKLIQYDNVENQPTSIDVPDPFRIEQLELHREKLLDIMVERQHIPRPKINLMMDYIEGENLTKLWEMRRLISVTVLLDIAIQFLSELQKIHDAGYFHQDLALRNVLFDPITGKVKIIDFGLAKIKDEKDDKNVKRKQKEQEMTSIFLLQLLGIDSVKGRKITNAFDADTELESKLAHFEIDNIKPIKDDLIKAREQLAPIYYKTIGILNITDYINAGIPDKEGLLAALKLMDAVVLVDNENTRDSKDYLRLRRELQERNIFVGNKVIFSKEPSALAGKIKEEYENKSDPTISHFCYFHTEKTPRLKIAGIQSIQADRSNAVESVIDAIQAEAPIVATPEDLEKVWLALTAALKKYCDENSVGIGSRGIENTQNFTVVEKSGGTPPPHVIKLVTDLKNTIMDMKEQSENNKVTYTYPALFAKMRRFEDAILQKKRFYKSKPESVSKLQKGREELDIGRHRRLGRH